MSYSNLDYLKGILRSPVYEAARNTDLNYLPLLSETLNNNIWLKREDQQPVKSFKLRGAYNKISQLTAQQLERGVVAASAGNHAQGVAYSARKKGVKATIVMPETTPEIKVEAVRKFGGDAVDIVLIGNNFDIASAHAKGLAEEKGLSYVPPFDDQDVIIGQGTIGKELLTQLPELDILFVAVGGGGLMAGIAIYLKQLKPDITIVAVEAEESACLQAALLEGKPVTLPSVGIFADGVAVKRMGEETFRICQQYVDDLVTVNNDEVCAAIKDTFDDTRVIAEPAGALSIAGLRKYVRQHNIINKQLAGILCGANINFHTLRYVSERCELGEQKEAIFAVKIPERKGAFRQFCHQLGGRVITEFNYRYAEDKSAHIFVGIRLKRGRTEYQAFTTRLNSEGYECFDLSDNEVAKLHVRYMVGGRPDGLPNERVFSFEFPEQPGALMTFLDTLGDNWNISLFHYRNHGAADGLVLAGFQVRDAELPTFERHLQQLGYLVKQESNNPAYQFFLSDVNKQATL